MLVVILHGKDTGPHGSKMRELAQVATDMGHSVMIPDMSDIKDPEARVGRLLETLEGHNGPLFVIGSSMGGYVAMTAAEKLQPEGMLLLAPAIDKPGYGSPTPPPPGTRVTIVHGWQDEVNPVDNSIRYAREFQCELHLVNDIHRLTGDVTLLEKVLRRELSLAALPSR